MFHVIHGATGAQGGPLYARLAANGIDTSDFEEACAAQRLEKRAA